MSTVHIGDGALRDFNGQANTAAILSAQNNGEDDYTIGKAVMDFRSGSNNEDQVDWFVPSCGELAYMFLIKTELSTLLGKVDGGRQSPVVIIGFPPNLFPAARGSWVSRMAT